MRGCFQMYGWQCVKKKKKKKLILMCSYLHLSDRHPLLCEHRQGRARPAGPHHIHSLAAVLKLLFGLQEGVSIQPDVSLQNKPAESQKTLDRQRFDLEFFCLFVFFKGLFFTS